MKPLRLVLAALLACAASAPLRAEASAADWFQIFGQGAKAFADGYVGAQQRQGGNDLDALMEGAALVAQDGTFLGYWSPPSDAESIFNTFGTYGNKFSGSSILNRFSTFGNKYNPNSPWNEYSQDPPMFVKGRKALCYLTTNRFKEPRLDPRVLFPEATQ